MFRQLEEKAEDVTYLLVQGKWHIINLNQKKGLFVKNFPIYTLQNRKLGLGMPFIQDDWVFRG